MQELIIKDSDILNPEIQMELKMERIVSIANQLNSIIENQNLYLELNGNKYVLIDGLTTLGTMLGLRVVEEEVKDISEEIPSNRRSNKFISYLARISIYKGDTIISTASNMCSNDERGKESHARFAIRSMAITRATGKAYRNCLSWIFKIAGYESTPAEEMDTIFGEYKVKNNGNNGKSGKTPTPNKTNTDNSKGNDNTKKKPLSKVTMKQPGSDPEEPPIPSYDMTKPNEEDDDKVSVMADGAVSDEKLLELLQEGRTPLWISKKILNGEKEDLKRVNTLRKNI